MEDRFKMNKEEFQKSIIEASENNPVVDLFLGFGVLDKTTLEETGWFNDEKDMTFKISVNGVELDALTFNEVFTSW